MTDLFMQNPVYTVMALAGTILFFIKILLLFFGGDSDFDTDLDIDMNGDHIDGGDTFSIVSIQSILAFFMGTGWIGLAAIHEWKLTNGQSTIAAALFGVIMMLFSSFITFKIKKFNSIPKVDIKEAVGKVGRAYTNIPSKGQGVGQVEVTVGNKQQILQASSVDEAINSFDGIVVVQVDDSGNLLVKKS
ncbi:hypothetical protein BIY24_14530 [Halobacteriovorax marinus]|uniref:Membrane protein n=1 Tax=Halobacteriovorax marinus (strain ATCC BAA-682 / DSM 15412 / SJ) TaxID=862908 RepID=E1WZD6_HALMS|nr:hypothetical protein [Halobacteriovorax marinus]ATH09115.1 hypothetical protein BIY24_14530 [Halobacteriovorax marinus]CBW27824.1 putative membrane protein [Halobacteriovorax marinus SJ]